MQDKELEQELLSLRTEIITRLIDVRENIKRLDTTDNRNWEKVEIILKKLESLENYLNIEYQEKAPENNDYPKYVKKEKK
jgi:hypothetical protein